MREPKPSFEIELPDSSVSIDEWRKAQTVPGNELPRLTSEQREVARKLGISEEAYARSLKAGEFGYERMLARARDFGECVAKILQESSSGVVDAVKADVFRGRWLVRLRNPDTILAFPRELVDDLLDSGSKSYLEQVRRLIREQLSVQGEKATR